MKFRHDTFKMEDVWTVAANFDRKSARRQPCANMSEANALLANPAAAEVQARELLKFNTADPVTLFVLGAVLGRKGHLEDARAILTPLCQSQPQNASAWRELGLVLAQLGEKERATAALLKALDLNYLDERVLAALADLLPFGSALFPLFASRRFDSALAQLDILLEATPDSILLHSLNAVALVGSGQIEAAIVKFESFIHACQASPGLWLEYARALRLNRNTRAAEAMRRAMEILPAFVEAYVLYASIKPFPWQLWMIDQVRTQLQRPDLASEDRALLHSCLGKAYEDAGRYAESFENYRACNEILHEGHAGVAKASANFARRTAAVFNPMLLRRRAGAGFPARGPIFIVGMKRSGSTLLEQILSRHSGIEALGELEDLTAVIGRVRGYPGILRDLDPRKFREMGEEYIALTAARRRLDTPFFTDKLPHNFGRVGLIHLILPNAKIVDVRRNPMDCGFSSYKHYFPGARLSLSLADLGSSYVDYVWLMSHFDSVLPGKVHRVIYERLVRNMEYEVRRLLNHLGLPFEDQCLRFHEDPRHVATPSADQVSVPLYNSAVEYWRHYEPWLGPMKEKLGRVLDVYPDVPKFFDRVNVRLRKPLSLGEAGGQFATVRGLRQPAIAALGPSSL